MKKNMKKKKIESIPKINRRLFKLWSEAVRDRAGFKCEYCNIENKAININGINTKLDAHHLVSRNVKDMPIKFDINNAVCVCPICHKWGMPSFHRDPVTTITWLIKNLPHRYQFVLNNSNIRIDLKNRMVLEEIEKKLVAKEPLNLEKLQQIEKDFPTIKKTSTTTTQTEATLLDLFKSL